MTRAVSGFAGLTIQSANAARRLCVGLSAAETTCGVPGETSSQMVTWGPYRFTRNPMYVGLTIAYLGEAMLLRQLWPVILLPLVIAYVHWIVIPLEESKLQQAFGEQFDRYRARVRRWV